MKLHKLSHLLLFFILLFPASGIIIIGCSSSVFARKPGTLSESKLNDIQQGMSGGEIINKKGYLVGINSKIAHPVLQTDFRYLQGEQPDEKTLKEWGNYSWGIAINLVDKAGAIKHYTQAITINPQDAEAYYNRGLVKYALGDKAGAIADFTQAITINPQLAEAYSNRGLAKSALGDKAGAIKDYTQAITINPQYAIAYSNRGNAKDDLGDKAGAIKDYTQAITINPQLAIAYYNRGVAKYESGDKAGAIKDLETAKQLFQQQGNTQNAQKVQEVLNKL
jgi:tetratricopeptide (TPR) repeat protein